MKQDLLATILILSVLITLLGGVIIESKKGGSPLGQAISQGLK
jgi:hypothetical protein